MEHSKCFCISFSDLSRFTSSIARTLSDGLRPFRQNETGQNSKVRMPGKVDTYRQGMTWQATERRFKLEPLAIEAMVRVAETSRIGGRLDLLFNNDSV